MLGWASRLRKNRQGAISRVDNNGKPIIRDDIYNFPSEVVHPAGVYRTVLPCYGQVDNKEGVLKYVNQHAKQMGNVVSTYR